MSTLSKRRNLIAVAAFLAVLIPASAQESYPGQGVVVGKTAASLPNPPAPQPSPALPGESFDQLLHWMASTVSQTSAAAPPLIGDGTEFGSTDYVLPDSTCTKFVVGWSTWERSLQGKKHPSQKNKVDRVAWQVFDLRTIDPQSVLVDFKSQGGVNVQFSTVGLQRSVLFMGASGEILSTTAHLSLDFGSSECAWQFAESLKRMVQICSDRSAKTNNTETQR